MPSSERQALITTTDVHSTADGKSLAISASRIIRTNLIQLVERVQLRGVGVGV